MHSRIASRSRQLVQFLYRSGLRNTNANGCVCLTDSPVVQFCNVNSAASHSHQQCLMREGCCAFTLGKGWRFIHTSTFQGVLSYHQKLPEVVPYRNGPSPIKRHGHHDNPMSQRLLSARTSEEIIHVLENEADKMDPIIISVAVDTLFDAIKSELASVKSKHAMLTSVGVQKLCKQLRRSGPHLDPADLINGVKLLSILCAPGNHQTLQVLLKLISKHANSLDLQQLAYLQFLLDKLHPETKSPLSKALEFALPVVFESQLESQLNRNDPQEICDYLHYATRYKLSEKTINALVEAALKITDRIPKRLVLSLMWSLCDIQNDNASHEPLVTWSYRKLTENFDDFKLSELNIVNSKAARKYQKRISYFYNTDFVNAYCQKCLQKGGDIYDILWAAKNNSLFRHVNIDLMDRIGEIIAADPSCILNNDTLFSILVKAFSSLNYKPETWDTFSSILLEHPALTKNYGLQEVSLALDFLALNLFPESMIRGLFSFDGLSLLEEFRMKYNPNTLVLLYNAVKNLYPNYKGPLPPVTMIESWKELSRAANVNRQYSLKGALQTGLGGESYLINGLHHDGLYIDHGIVMRKGGYPVAMNSQCDSQSDCLNSITKPAESVIILLKVFPKESYASNTRRLRGVAALELRILEQLGNPVVAVDLENWMDLPDFEKIPFLMHRVREKMEHLQWNQTWGDVIPP
ncbi:unnamed protein product [Orchesella dallaii]|uniref:RAP domain-containing protein n=1 Tax=Orchesella dallaii TaxID=48710 RepID=A0ABP1QS00_9HEXA